MFSQVEEELESFLYNLWEEIFHVGFHIFKRKILNSTASFQILHWDPENYHQQESLSESLILRRETSNYLLKKY